MRFKGKVALITAAASGIGRASADIIAREGGRIAAVTPQVGTPGLAGFGTTLQNTLETSNVSTVEEMVNMITTQRAYEMNSKVISTADQMLSFVTQNL